MLTKKLLPFTHSALALALSMSGAALAQTEQLEEVTVTGSRLRNITGMSTPTPVTAVTNQELAVLSPNTLIAGLSQLPQFLGNTTNDVRTGFFNSPGAGNLNLRGLNTGGGSGRTLTLLDGRRVVPATGAGGVDINILPSALVQRVDTVTGGASAAYGTDAVAGAVNFVLDTNYTGWRASAQSGTTGESDRDNIQYSVAWGAPIGERMHLLLSGEYYEADLVKSISERDWYKGYSLINNPAPAPAPRYLRRPDVVSSIATFGGLINSGVPTTSALYRQHFQPDGSLAPFVLGEGTATHAHSITNGGSGDDTSGTLLALAPKAERYSAFAYLSFDATPNLSLFAQGLAGQSMTDQPNHGGRFAAVPGIDTRITIYRENAFLPAAVRQIMDDENLASFQMNVVGDREGLGRTSRLKQDNETYSGTVGFDWDLTDGLLEGWQVNGYAQFGTADNRGYQENALLDRIAAATDAIVDPNDPSRIVCRAATIDPAKWGDCAPLNLFGRGNASDAAIAYTTNFTAGQQITSPLFFQPDGYDSGKTVSYTSGIGKVYNTETRQTVFDLAASGPVGDGWAGPIVAAVGVAWRKEEIEQIVWDPSNPASDPGIFPARDPALRGVPIYSATRSSMTQNSTVPNVHGEYVVKEAFTEFQIPLLADKPWADELTLLVAGRAAEYTGSGNVWSWKTGLDWQVYSDLRLRATVSQDVRAATLLERFNQTGGIGTVTLDPMFPDDGAQTFSSRSGGNPNLDPETSKTYTYGFVYQPGWLENFSVSVDYWDVDIAGAIGSLGFQRIVDDCFSGAANVCNLVTRDPVTNRLSQVRNITQNIAASAGRGVDVEVSYRRPVSLFRDGNQNLGGRLFWSHMKENSTMTDRGNPATYFDLAGQTGLGNLPEDSVTAILTYNLNAFNLSMSARYISSGIFNKRYNLPTAARPDVEDNTVPSVVYLNMSGGYSWELSNGGTLEFFANAQNLLDKDPPVVASVFDAALGQQGTQYNQGLFDLLGRRFTIGVNFRH